MKIKIECKDVGLNITKSVKPDCYTGNVFEPCNAVKFPFVSRADGDIAINATGWYVEECAADCVAFETRQAIPLVNQQLQRFAIQQINNYYRLRLTITRGKKESVLVDVGATFAPLVKDAFSTYTARCVRHKVRNEKIHTELHILESTHRNLEALLETPCETCCALIDIGQPVAGTLADALKIVKQKVEAYRMFIAGLQKCADEHELDAAAQLKRLGFCLTKEYVRME